MKLIISKVIVLSFLFAGIMLTGSCTKSDEDLSAPTKLEIVKLTDHSVIIEWKAVKNSTHYRFTFDSEGYRIAGGVCSDTRLSYEMLEPGTTYHFSVRAEDETRATPADGGDYPLFSDWAELDFTTPGNSK